MFIVGMSSRDVDIVGVTSVDEIWKKIDYVISRFGLSVVAVSSSNDRPETLRFEFNDDLDGDDDAYEAFCATLEEIVK